MTENVTPALILDLQSLETRESTHYCLSISSTADAS
jgi:hypothetical protein